MAGALEPLRAERRAAWLGFACYFVLLACTYVLRPLRDTMATVFGVDELQWLFTLTFACTLLSSPIFAWLTLRMRLTRLLPAVYWFLLAGILVFYLLFRLAPDSRALAAGYYAWYSTINVLMVSVFWSLMVDLFSPAQAQRHFAFVAAGGSLGSIVGPVLTSTGVAALGVDGLLLVAAGAMALLVATTHWLIREKAQLQVAAPESQRSTLDHALAGRWLDGFAELRSSPLLRNQMWFMLLMTWVATVGYFLQTDLIARSFSGMEARTQAIANIDLVVNVLSALILTFGLGRFVQRFGVTASLFLNPVIMVLGFVAVALSPTLLMVQGLQVARRVSQYAIARPAREMCFTVVPQASRYRAKNVVDTVVYRAGDVVAAWMQAGLRGAGFGMAGTVVFGLVCSGLWGVSALALGRRYESARKPGAPAEPLVVY